MIYAILRWVLTFVCLSILLTWALLNRGAVTFDMSPVHDPVHWPLFAPMLLAAFIGFIWGMGATWINGASVRHARRRLEKENKALTKQIDDTSAGVTQI